MVIRLEGAAPVHGKRHEFQRLRCNLCGAVFTAQAPEDIGPDKYDVTVASTIGVLKYGSGMPFYRLEKLQANAGIPLPAGTQWEIVCGPVPIFEPVYQELIWLGAQGDVLYQDDTKNRILELMGKRLAKAQAQNAALATGSQTDGAGESEKRTARPKAKRRSTPSVAGSSLRGSCRPARGGASRCSSPGGSTPAKICATCWLSGPKNWGRRSTCATRWA